MINQNQWRSYFLALTSIGSNIAVVYALGFSTVSNRSVVDFEFPATLNLNSGQITAIKTSLNQNKNNSQEGELLKASQKYQYTHKKPHIELEVSYLVGTRGDVGKYLQNYSSIDSEIIKNKKIQYSEEIGYHALFTQDNRAYLSSCISPRSLSNVTQKQFSSNRYQNDLQLQVGWDWLRGKASIRDRRCLWLMLSTPITSNDSQAAEQALEIAWSEQYQWWSANFPPLTNNP